MRDTIKLGFMLFLITAIAALVLSVSNQITAPKILESIIKTNQEARLAVLDTADTFEKIEVQGEENIVEIYEGNKDDLVVGYTIKTISNGFGGKLEVLTGISKDGEVTGMKLLSHTETPGLGANAAKDEFQSKFLKKNSTDLVSINKVEPQNDNEVQAITGATITSKAVAKAVNTALEYFEANFK